MQTINPTDDNGYLRYEKPATDAQEIRRRHEANRIGWNEGAASYSQEVDATIAFLREGRSSLHPIEREHLGNLGEWCRRAIHLQCASGRDTLSLHNEGVAEVIGVDISDTHIDNARHTSEALGVPAAWYRCDILDTPGELDGTADLVYTGQGAICWLHDLDAWARVVARLLKPGGVFHILDGHPIVWLFDPEAETLVGSGIDYFEHSESAQGWGPTYIGNMGRPTSEHARKYERIWTPAQVFTALVSAGLSVEIFGEHREGYWDAMPNLIPEWRGLLPMTFSMMASKKKS